MFVAPVSRRPPPERRPARAALYVLVRTIGLAALVVVAAAWALARHYLHTARPMLVPALPATAATYDVDSVEIPFPETVEPDAR